MTAALSERGYIFVGAGAAIGNEADQKLHGSHVHKSKLYFQRIA